MTMRALVRTVGMKMGSQASVIDINEFVLQSHSGMARIRSSNEDEMWDEEDGFFYDLLRLPAVYGGSKKFQTDPHRRDLLLFYEYFHGDNGASLGASHQTGWTGLVGALIPVFSQLNDKEWLENGIAFGMKQEKLSPANMQQEPARR